MPTSLCPLSVFLVAAILCLMKLLYSVDIHSAALADIHGKTVLALEHICHRDGRSKDLMNLNLRP